jgi:23S rRNA (guanosine2251-2'-O)-methyltransferase
VLIFGINPVIEALKAGRVARLRVADHGGPRIREILDLAAAARVEVQQVGRPILDHAAHGGAHQGVVAELEQPREWSPTDLVREAPGPALVVVLDGIEDPHNVGAILRTADAAGADGVIRQTRHAAALGGAAAKASAGAIAHVRVAEVVNIARAIEELKAAGVWTVGLAADGDRRYDLLDMTMPTALVLGAEGTGIRRLVRERCDWLVSIPMLGHVDSLNVSVAAGVVLFEAVRQRRQAASGGRAGGEEAGTAGTAGKKSPT